MLSAAEFQDRCRIVSRLGTNDPVDNNTMIGIFQRFRPAGNGLEGLYKDLPHAGEYHRRLDRLFAAAGEDRRPNGGRDAYFVVRNPPPMSAEVAEFQAIRWLESLLAMATKAAATGLMAQLDPVPRIRVLVGAPPKQPKSDLDSFPLLKAIKVDAAALTDGIAQQCLVVLLLRDAYYFAACDAMLRDYLLWPAYAEHFADPDPMSGYFELWRHGVKLRVFHDDMIDLYLPRA